MLYIYSQLLFTNLEKGGKDGEKKRGEKRHDFELLAYGCLVCDSGYQDLQNCGEKNVEHFA